MKSKVITLATSKGGAGKSTLARNLAAHWFHLGMDVAVIDADPQGSIISRHDANGLLGKMTVVAEPEETVGNLVEELKEKHPIVIVDTGGFRNKTTIRSLVATDLAIIPLKPSADDVSGALETHNLIQEINNTPERIQSPIKYRMILTMTQQGIVIARHIRTELEQMGFLVLKAEMFHRVSYPEAAINGLSPCILDPEGPAARDIVTIVRELNNAL